ncbi:hypothetical protein [Nonomuraea sp. NPDC049709]|uniref:hypothetical protein n=1 Tax=Nonomuraea sp. NPDC049709 TaxID=3154736 RepID=UPI003416997A
MRLRTLRVLAALVLTVSLAAEPAAAEVEHPRQQWSRDSPAGLLLHWGMFTAPRHTAAYWVEEARKLGTSYIVLATSTAGRATRARGTRSATSRRPA